MLVLIISDSHGNLSGVAHLVGFAKTKNLGAIIHCGDFSTAQDVVETLKAGIPVYAVMGNADEARYQEIYDALSNSEIHFAPDTWIGKIGGRRIAITHQPEKVRDHINSGKYDAVFHGHLHMSAGVKTIDNTLVVNPGALGNTIKPSFAVYDTNSNTATIIDLPV